MGGTLFVLLAAVGFGLMWAMGHVENSTVKAVMIRAAAFAFAGAGIIGAGGMLGRWARGAVFYVNTQGAAAGTQFLGTAAVWIVWLLLGAAWVLTMLPESWFSIEIPDWLSMSGLVLPPLMHSVPGPVGHMLTSLIDGAGGLMISVVRSMTGM